MLSVLCTTPRPTFQPILIFFSIHSYKTRKKEGSKSFPDGRREGEENPLQYLVPDPSQCRPRLAKFPLLCYEQGRAPSAPCRPRSSALGVSAAPGSSPPPRREVIDPGPTISESKRPLRGPMLKRAPALRQRWLLSDPARLHGVVRCHLPCHHGPSPCCHAH